jgi:hypothetical protein
MNPARFCQRAMLSRSSEQQKLPMKLTPAALCRTLFCFLVILQMLVLGPGDARAACASLPVGGVAWWRGEGDARDILGGSHASFAANTFTTGRVGQAFQFNGSQFAQAPDHASLDFSNAFTIELWAFPTAAGLANGTTFLVSKGNMAFVTTQSYGILFADDRRVLIRIANGSSLDQLASTSALPLNNWSHVAVTYDGGTMRVFVNGVLENSQATSISSLLNTSEGFMMGGADFGGGSKIFCQAVLDEVALYKRALTAGEVLDIFNVGSGGKCVPVCTEPLPGMVGWWRGESNVLDQISTNNGILRNGATFTNGIVGGTAFFLPGVSGYVEIPSAPSLVITGAITIEAWLFRRTGGQNSVLSKTAGRPARAGWDWELYPDGALEFYVDGDGEYFNGNDREFRSSPGTVPSNVWTHVVTTFDPATQIMKIYANGMDAGGSLVNGGTVNSIFPTTDPIRISGFQGGQSNPTLHFRGNVDEVGLYNRALTSNEVAVLFASRSAGRCIACAPQPPNMVSWWRGENNPLDLVGTNHGSLVNGASFAAGRVGQAFRFISASNSGLIVPSSPSLNPTEAITLEAWVNPSSYPNTAPTVFRKANSTFGVQYLLGIGDGNSAGIAHFNLDGISVTAGAVPLNAWTHLAGTYDRQALRLFVNGVQVASSPTNFPIATSSMNLGIGKMDGATDRNFDGMIDEPMLYDRALSAAEIQASFVAGSSGHCFTAPVAPLVIVPLVTNIIAQQGLQLIVSGGLAPYSFAVATNNSGGSVGLFSGFYVAGPIGNVADAVRVTDNRGSNAIATISVLADPTPRPNLAVHQINAPPSAQPGVPISVTWVVTNLGTATASGPWIEEIYASTDLQPGNDLFLLRMTNAATLSAGASVTRTQAVNIPTGGDAGLLRLIIVADASGIVHEADESNNIGISANGMNVPLTLTLTAGGSSVVEGGAMSMTVTRNGIRNTPLTVNLFSSDTTELTLPVSVIIPAGAAFISFSGSAPLDGLFDGPQLVSVSATSSLFVTASANVTVLDSDVPRLFLSFNDTNLIEGDSVTGTITRELVTTSPLVVTLSGGSGQLAFPGTVTIASNQASAVFSLSAIPDTLIERTNSYPVTASAAGVSPASAVIVVEDDDIPNLTIVLAAHSVSEGAGANATIGTVLRAEPSPRAVVVALFSANTNAARVAASVTIPAGQTGAVFSVAAVNNSDVDGSRTAVIGGFALETGTGTPLREATPDTLTVTDDDGPTLRVVLARDLVGEGLNPATTATVSRNNGTSGALTVNLNSSDTTEATVPASVVIPNGTNAVTFAITSLNDGTMDGNQSVTFTASAAGFAPGSAVLVVSDADLPDLVVANVSAPTNALTGQQIDVGFRIVNQGIASAGSNFLQRLSISTDAQAGDDTVLAQASFNGSIPVGLFFEQTLRVFLPQTPGNYWIVVGADANNQVGEILEDNNVRVAAVPMVVQKSYSATVIADVDVAPAGTSIVLHGHATRTGTNTPAAFELVNVHVMVRGTKRILTALTDPSGNYSVTFTPLASEGGLYTVGADHPGVIDTPAQDSFTLIGMKVQPVPLARVVEGSNVTVMTTVENLSNVGLNGVAATVLSGPPGLTLTPALASNSIPGDGSVALSLNVNAPLGSQNAGAFHVRLTSTEGAITEFDVPVSLEILAPRLVATPSSLVAGMKRGGQASVSFGITNAGGAATGPLTVLLPPLPWMRVSAGASLPPLAPGTGTEISLLLTPASDITLGDYTGSIAVNSANASVAVPFSFRALSDNIGHLELTAISELTFYAEGSPNVSNATVRLSDVASGAVILTTNIGPTGIILLTNLTEAFYQVHVEAPNHSPFDATILIEATKTNILNAFLSRQTVRYTWIVEPTFIEDFTRITIETVFETAVPIPVVTVEPSLIDLQDFAGTERQVDLKISNHGLIAAQSGLLNFESHSFFTFTPLIEDIGLIPAQSSLTVPVIIRKVPESDRKQSAAKASGDVRCQITGTLKWSVPCGGMTITHEVKIPVLNLIDRFNLSFNCGPTPPPASSGAVCCGGGGVVFPGGGIANPSYTIPIAVSSKPPSCDPCVQKRTKVILIDCPLKFLPLPSYPSKLKKAADCYDALKNAGLSPSDFAKALWKCEKGAVTTFGGTSGKNLGPIANALECLYEITTACAGLGGPPPPGGFGLGKFFTSTGAKNSSTNDPMIQPLLREIDRMFVTLAPVTNLFGSRVWLQDGDDLVYSNWFGLFDSTTETNSNEGVRISASERASLMTLPFPGTATTNDATRFIDRWNRTVDYYEAGIFNDSSVPVGQSHDFLAVDILGAQWDAADEANDAILNEGYTDGLDAVIRTRDTLIDLLSLGSGGVCAKVKLRLDQDAIISRDAFKAMLEIDNSTSDPLEEISVELHVRNEAGAETTDLFQIRTPVLNGLSGVSGGGILPAQSIGSASWIIVPTSLAAPTNQVRHLVSGTLRYKQAGVVVTVPLVPTPIDVLPNPKLSVDYFHQRDVFSDDPFTLEIEPSIPFTLGVMVRNEGYGTARNMRIQSGQPRIIENDKGLLINFEIIATEVSGVGLTPTLTANFGDITPGEIAIGRWLFKSSLQGLFTDYSATFEHVSGLGDRRLSLIDRVDIHEMIHVIQADRGFEDGLPDFLVNDIPDFLDTPDTIYFSNGTNAPVLTVTSNSVDAPVTLSHLTVQLSAPMPVGWGYLRIPDPGDATFRLREVRRADNSIVSVNTNVWRTDRTFIGLGVRPIRENTLHLVDFNSAGTYTLIYEPAGPLPDTNAPISSVAALPSASPVNFNVTWSGSDGTNGSIAFFDIFVSIDGGPFTSWLMHTLASGAVYEGEVNHTYAFYSRATDSEGNAETAPANADAQTSTTIVNTRPVVSLGGTQTIDEGATLSLTVSVTDTDAPPQSFAFALLPGSPPGLLLNGSGALTFPTSEGTGPSTNQFSVRVTDNGVPSLSATASVTVIVREVNSAPVLSVIPNRTINEGSNLVFTAMANDFDLPVNSVAFSLGAPVPLGATITSNGLFSWQPNSTQGPSSNRLHVIATDNGVPALSATQSFTVLVRDTRADFTLSLGSTNVFGGQSNAVPVRWSTGLELSQIVFDLGVSNRALGNLLLTAFAPEVTSASMLPINADQFRVQFVLSGGAQFEMERTLAQLGFMGSVDGPSASVPLHIDSSTGSLPGGGTVTNAAVFHGHIVVVNAEPVVELEGHAKDVLQIFARPGNYRVEATSNLQQPAWQTVTNFTVSGSSARLPLPPSGIDTRYYRVVSP